MEDRLCCTNMWLPNVRPWSTSLSSECLERACPTWGQEVSVVPSVMGQLFISELSTSPLQAARERSLEREF